MIQNVNRTRIMKTKIISLITTLLVLLAGRPNGNAQGTAFTYQGRLDSGGAPFTGNAEFQPTLWSAMSGGTQVAANNPAALTVPVTNGLFVLPLDFGANFPGADRWLQLEVRTALGPFTTLSPRQRLTATPYAITAGTAQLARALPAGTVTTAMLASNAVTAGQIATGAVGTTQLADDAVTTSKLDATHFQGTVSASTLLFSSLNAQGFSLAVTFDRPLNATPTVTFDPPSTQLEIASSNGFSARAQFQVHALRLGIAVRPHSSLTVVNGRPAISFFDAGLKFTRASDAGGVGPWTVVTVDADVGVDANESSLGIVNGVPAISYRDLNDGLKFAYAADAQGSGPWTVVLVDDVSDRGGYSSLAVVNGRPAISYHDAEDGELFFAYASDAQGSGPWTVEEDPIDVPGPSGQPVGLYTSLAVVNGRPAISYHDAGDDTLKFASAANAQGSGVWTLVTVQSAGAIGRYTSLAVINGRPAISYYDYSSRDLKFAYASDAQGTGPWNVRTLDSAGDVGEHTSLEVIQGLPVISYYDVGNRNLKIAVASDAQGAGAWNTFTIDSAGDVGTGTSLAFINGTAAVSYNDASNGQLKYATVPDVHWSAGTGDVAPLLAAGVSANSIATAQLLDEAVTTTKIADGTIQGADINAASFSTLFWKADGNASTIPGTHFLGTTDNRPLEIRVNGLRAGRFEFGGDSPDDFGTDPDGAPNVILGAPVNFVAAGTAGATIAGGGATNYNGVAYSNSIQASFGTIGGGINNTIAKSSAYSTIAGGSSHDIGTNSAHSAIGGGQRNNIAANSSHGTIGGGDNNAIAVSSRFSTIGGGTDNTVNGYYGTIAGGLLNEADYVATVGGGWGNIASGSASTVGGGYANTASGGSSTVPGGAFNTAAGNVSFAAGNRAKANHYGSFIWCDGLNQDGATHGSNVFVVRASGGARFYSSGGSTGVNLPAGGGSWNNLSDSRPAETVERTARSRMAATVERKSGAAVRCSALGHWSINKLS